MLLKYFARKIRKKNGYFSNRGIVPVTILAIATLMLQIIAVQSTSVTTENPSATSETAEIEKIQENIIIKIGLATYDLCTNRNVIICLVVILVVVCVALKLTSIEWFFRKILLKDFTAYDVPLNNFKQDTSRSESLIDETALIINVRQSRPIIDRSNLVIESSLKPARFRSVPRRANLK